jgi:uncharacterized protein (DUF2249 family)
MLTINADTKIASLIKEHAGALDAIISISPKFNKLKNPLLRKLFASRTSIYMASKVSGCAVNDFFEKLTPLGFIIDDKPSSSKEEQNIPVPMFVHDIEEADIVELDVREVISSGKDPLNLILTSVKKLQAGQLLKLINSFEPTPLMQLLGKQGFESYVENVNDDLVYTFFHKKDNKAVSDVIIENSADGWDEIIKKYHGNLETIDVRYLQMPLPMHNILEALDKLPEQKALYVIHKRIPVFLLPELRERNFDYRIKEVADGEVYLLIFKA